MVAVAAAKKKKSKSNAGSWGFRLAGIVLCAFFALGVITGLSRPGRVLALRVEALFNFWPRLGHSSIIPAAFLGGRTIAPTMNHRAPASAIALVERAGSYYALDSDGGLRGPVAPTAQGDLPILSGEGAAGASPEELIGCAETLVRAEAGLGAVVSEMRIGSGGTAAIFLERPRIEIDFDLDRTAGELARASIVLAKWRGHEDLIASLDLTTPGQAVMRLKPAAFAAEHRTPALQRVALAARGPMPRSGAEVSARR